MRGFKIAHSKLGKQLRNARAHLSRLLNQRRDAPKRVEVRELNDRALVKLATERKHLTDIIKMVAYQVESDLLALLQPHYARVDQEGRTLLHELFATAGDIRVSDSELNITLAPLSSPPHARRPGALREPRQNGDNLPRLSPAHPVCGASPTAHRACLPRLAGQTHRRHSWRPGSLRAPGRQNRTFLQHPMSGALNLGFIGFHFRVSKVAREQQGEVTMGRGILLWLLGVPIPIIILLALFWH